MVFNRKLMREKREKLLMTQEELAEKMETSKTNVCFWETGRRNPSLKTIKKLACALNSDSDEFFVAEN